MDKSLFLNLAQHDESELTFETADSEANQFLNQENHILIEDYKNAKETVNTNKLARVVSLEIKTSVDNYIKLLNDILQPHILAIVIDGKFGKEVVKALKKNKAAQHLTSVNYDEDLLGSFAEQSIYFLTLYNLNALRRLRFYSVSFVQSDFVALRNFMNIQENMIVDIFESIGPPEAAMALRGLNIDKVLFLDAEDIAENCETYYVLIAKEIMRAEKKERKMKLPFVFTLDSSVKINTVGKKYFYTAFCKSNKCCLSQAHSAIDDFKICVPRVLGTKGQIKIISQLFAK